MQSSWNKPALISALLGMTLFALFFFPSAFATPVVAPVTQVGNLLLNPGFEADVGTGSPTGWSSSGTVSADFTESGGHSGNYRLSHWSAANYVVETRQTITGLNNGSHTLRVWVKSGGGQNQAYIGLKNCGSPSTTTPITQTSTTDWVQLEVSVQVTTGQCTVALYSDANAGNWTNFDDAEFVDDSAPTPTATATATNIPLPTPGSILAIRGADVSSLDKSEVFGGTYRYADGTEGDALEILSDSGLNYIRLRVWVDPADGYHTKERILGIAQRAHNQGIGVLVDFHYSDFWADPGRQDKPSAWAIYDFEELKNAVYDHTREVCEALVAQGTPPDMVQIGNEINGGMIWPDGQLAANNYEFDKLAALLNQGIQAIEDCSPNTRIMLHLAEGGNLSLLNWWYGEVIVQGVQFDVMGVSYYPYWHGSLAQLQTSLNTLAQTYNKDIVIVEFAYPFVLGEDDDHDNIVYQPSQLTAGYPASPEGQRVMTRTIMNIVSQIPGNRGLGVFYWDGTWTAVEGNGWDPTDPDSGNAWENQALFGFDDRLLPAALEFTSGVTPPTETPVPSNTPSATATNTPTPTASNTATPTHTATAVPTNTPTATNTATPQVLRTLTYTWHQTSGAPETGTWRLYANGDFSDNRNRTGQWAYQASSHRLALLYDEGYACNAFLLGNSVQQTLVRGVSLCLNGSPVIGVWRATIHPGQGFVQEKMSDQGSPELLSDKRVWEGDILSSNRR